MKLDNKTQVIFIISLFSFFKSKPSIHLFFLIGLVVKQMYFKSTDTYLYLLEIKQQKCRVPICNKHKQEQVPEDIN